jgi:hypothetical protein
LREVCPRKCIPKVDAGEICLRSAVKCVVFIPENEFERVDYHIDDDLSDHLTSDELVFLTSREGGQR